MKCYESLNDNNLNRPPPWTLLGAKSASMNNNLSFYPSGLLSLITSDFIKKYFLLAMELFERWADWEASGGGSY